MTLRDMITDSVYRSLVAENATFIDPSGDEIAVRIVPQTNADDVVIGAEIGMRGNQRQFFIRKSSLSHRPCEGDKIVYEGSTYCIARLADDFNKDEWLIDVRA